MRNFEICTPHQMLLRYHIAELEVGGACSTCGRRREMHTGFWWGNLKDLRDLEVDGRIILKSVIKE